MAAYGAVISLSQTLDTILHPDRSMPVTLDRVQLESLREKVTFLQQFLENPLRNGKNAGQSLETKIRDAAFNAELVVESEIYDLLVAEREIQLKNLLFPSVFATAKIIIFVLVGSLCHFAINRFVPGDIQHLMHRGVEILVGVLTLHILATFLDQILAELRPRFQKLISVAMQYMQHNSETEAPDLDQVTKEVSSVINELIDIGNQYSRNLSRVASSSRVDSVVTGNIVVVGFERDLLEIKTLLISGSSKLEAVSIVGMGGIGKTTLARQVYDDSYIRYHFDIQAWVTISQEYSLRRVLRGLLDSAGMLTEKMSERSENELGLDLYQNLIGRRYLIVMDDIWDTEIWDRVRRFLPNDNNGSRVILATRLSQVAIYANQSARFNHVMRFLDQDQSWDLLRSKVFGERNCPVELEELGRVIAKNCGGLPLAIVVIGGLLSEAGRTDEYWRNTARNLDSAVTNEDEHYMKILCLSYDNLPHCLRPCFLYMCVFPKHREIPVSKLVRLWASEGFIRSNGSRSLEDLAEDYLEDLISRNLVLVSERKANGKVKTCSIHDVLWNFCLHKAHEENFLYVVRGEEGALTEGKKPPCSRLVIQADGSISSSHSSVPKHTFVQKVLYDIEMCSSSLHSFLCTGPRYSSPSRFYLGYRLLRVLDLLLVSFFDFPDEILKLYNLRYLALTYHKAFPPSISKLFNLHTILHYSYFNLSAFFLPKEILQMAKLRHIFVVPSFFPDLPFYDSILANSSFVLENLQTLLDIRNFRCSLKIIKKIPNLKKLGISYDDLPSLVWSKYQLESLVNLHQLETLKLVIKNSSDVSCWPSFAFPQVLKSLNLSGCAIPWKSLVIIGRLPNLEVLKLRNLACKGSKWKAVKNKFRGLKHLLLENLDLVRWRAQKCHFPCLERLIIRSCNKLKRIPSGIGKIPTLEMIELVDCRAAVVNSAREIQEEQESMGNMDLKVHVQSSRPFKYKRLSTELRRL